MLNVANAAPNLGSRKYFIAIAGNIGVGKSSLTSLLEAQLGWEPFYEAVGDNPYLADFYADMARWSFHSQIFFLSRRLQHHQQILAHPTSVVQDRSVYEDAEIFARNLHEQGAMTPRDYQVYCELYQTIITILPPPDLILYLRAEVPTLLQRIAKRGRDFEKQMSPAYLAQLNRLYDEWANTFTRCPVLTLSADALDFVAHPSHLNTIVAQILAHLPAHSALPPERGQPNHAPYMASVSPF